MANRILYRGIFAVVAVVALGAVLFGTVGLYTVLTGGTDAGDGGDGGSLLGAYQCDAFDGDPEMPHESEIGEPLTVVGDSQLEQFNATGEQIEVVTTGALINASASRPDGTVLPVDRFPDENRVVVPLSESAPFRLFLDSLDEEGAAVRTQLDVCPPEGSGAGSDGA